MRGELKSLLFKLAQKNEAHIPCGLRVTHVACGPKPICPALLVGLQMDQAGLGDINHQQSAYILLMLCY